MMKSNENIIVKNINNLISKNKEFDVNIKTNKSLRRYHVNEDSEITEIIEGKFYEEGKFMDILFTNYFKQCHNVVYSQGTGFLIFNGMIWESCSDIHIQQLISKILEKEDEITNAKISSTFRMLVNQVNNDKLGELLNSNRHRLTLKNGTLDISNIESPIFYENQFFLEDYCTIQLNVNYNIDALNNCKTWDYYLKSTFENDKERIKLIGEMMGYALTISCKYHKSFMLIGEGSNGKSVLLDIIDHIWGDKNISDVDISELNRAFSRVSLFGKLINKSSEIDYNLKNTSYFKKIVSGDKLDGEFKGKDKFSFVNTAKLIFAMNTLPMTKDKSDGWYRRLIIIPFNKQFKGKDIDINLSEKLKLEADAIFMFALEGLQRLTRQKGFTESNESTNKFNEYKFDSNPIQQFINEKFETTDEESDCIVSTKLYEYYVDWCKDNGYKSLNNVNFGKELKRLNLNKKQKRFNEKVVWVYCNLIKL